MKLFGCVFSAILLTGLLALGQGSGELVLEETQAVIDEGGFAMLRVKLAEAPPAPVTVTYEALGGGAENIYLRTIVGIQILHDNAEPSGDLLRLELYDYETPLTVANFLDYLTAGDYDGSFFHRLVTGFVIQGGGFTMVEQGADFLAERIPTNDPVPNEPGISNVRGTVAMAKLGGDPDSATNQWFVNLADNSGNLDSQNGGFTVFGNVLPDDMPTVDELGALESRDLSGEVAGIYASAMNEVPVHDLAAGAGFGLDNLVAILSASVLPRELVFTPWNYDQWQEIRVYAAPDDDSDNGSRTIRFSAAGMPDQEVLVEDRDSTVAIDIQEGTQLYVSEDGIGTFHVRLTGPPSQDTYIQMAWQSGDPDIWEATFARFETSIGSFDVELYDHLASDTVLYFRHYVLNGYWEGMFFHEHDEAGDELRAGRFGNNVSNYYYVQQMTYFAAEAGLPPGRGNLVVRTTDSGADGDAPHWYVCTGTTPAAGDDVVFGSVVDTGMDVVDQITSLPAFDLESYLETYNPGLELGGIMENTPMHSWDETSEPSEANLVNTGVTITSFPLFTATNWDQWQEIKFRALKDADMTAGTAIFRLSTTQGNVAAVQVAITEIEPQLGIELDRTGVTVPEGPDEPPAAMGVRLTAPPDAPLQIVAQISGDDPDISLAGSAVIEFDGTDWETWKFFTFAAAEDVDTTSGSVTVSLHPSVDETVIPSPPSFPVQELDDDFVVTLAIAPAGGGDLAPLGPRTIDADDLPYDLPLPQPEAGQVFYEWEVAGADSSILSSLRQVPTRLLAAATATVTAHFGADADNDTLPDPWEEGLGFPPALVLAAADPDRDGRTTGEEFLDNTPPLMYEIPLAAGWNGVGMGAAPGAGSSREATPFPPGLWLWDGNTYATVDGLAPFQTGWHFSEGEAALAIPVSLPEPASQIALHAGWNFMVVDQEHYTGSIQSVMGGQVSPAGWGWANQVFFRTVAIAKDVPIWVFSEIDQVCPLQAQPGRGPAPE